MLAKSNLNTIRVLIFIYFDSYINCNEFVAVNNVLEYNEIKQEIKNPENAVKYTI